MLHIGITGGMGSGKSTVCRLFSLLGIPTYNADQRAKWLMENDPELKDRISATFGANAYDPEGRLNRAYLASLVFPDTRKLQQLNDIVHPAVFRDTRNWQKQLDAPYSIRESALLFESGYIKYVDRSVLVFAPREVRIKRIMNRDGLSRPAILDRMARQMPEEEKRARADHIIINDGQQLLIPQVLELHHLFIRLAHKKDTI